jgi:hypothetical protein
MAHDVFISHSTKDKIKADTVCAVLEANGIRCWVAPRDVLAGEDWMGSIMSALDDCAVVVLVFSQNANDSGQVRREIQRALSRELPVIPFRIEKVKPTGAMEYSMSATHWLDAFNPPLEEHVSRLAGTVKVYLERLGRKTEPGLSPPPSVTPAVSMPAGGTPPSGGSSDSSGGPQPKKKITTRCTVVLTAAEAASGVEKSVHVPVPLEDGLRSCGECGGRGHLPGNEREVCPSCGGAGDLCWAVRVRIPAGVREGEVLSSTFQPDPNGPDQTFEMLVHVAPRLAPPPLPESAPADQIVDAASKLINNLFGNSSGSGRR